MLCNNGKCSAIQGESTRETPDLQDHKYKNW